MRRGLNLNINCRTLEELFKQLGLSSQQIHIERFIERHELKPGSVLENAIYWYSNQRTFLMKAKNKDSEWCEVVNQLANLLIRTPT